MRIVAVGWRQRITSCESLPLEENNESHLANRCSWMKITNCALRIVVVVRKQRIAYPDSLLFVRGDKYEALGRHLSMNERSKSV